MKKFIVCIVALVASLMVFTANAQNVNVPQNVQEKVLSMAVNSGALSTTDVEAVKATNCIQRTVNAFFQNWKPAEAVNEMLTCAVEAGYYSNVDAAKKAFKKNIEAARQKESTWSRIYSTLGL